MATRKQIELRIKYAKTSVNSLTKKIAMQKAKVCRLEAEMKKAKAAKPAKRAPAKKRAKKRR